jgi:hypothetical protein
VSTHLSLFEEGKVLLCRCQVCINCRQQQQQSVSVAARADNYCKPRLAMQQTSIPLPKEARWARRLPSGSCRAASCSLTMSESVQGQRGSLQIRKKGSARKTIFY